MLSNTDIAFSNVNIELNYPANTNFNLGQSIVRQLTGNSSTQDTAAPISVSQLADKTAFSEVWSPSTANTQSDQGTSISAKMAFVANSDFYAPNVAWSYTAYSGLSNTDVVFQSSGKNANITLTNTGQGTVKAGNVIVQAIVSVDGFVVGTKTREVSLSATLGSPNLTVTGSSTVTANGFAAQTATTAITGSAVSGNIVFVATRLSGTPITPQVVGNTITFSVSSLTPGVVNNSVWSLTTENYYNGSLIASDTRTINVYSEYTVASLALTVPATTNNNFSNSGNMVSSLLLTGSHSVPGANVYWSATKVSGDNASFSGSNTTPSTTANLSLSTTGFEFKKAVYQVEAQLRYANGYLISSNNTTLTLRTGAYGLTIAPMSSNNQQGYTAQTAIGSATASWAAGTFNWDITRISGSPLSVVSSVGSNTAYVNITSTANNGANSAVYQVQGVISYDSIVVANVGSNSTINAVCNSYTFTLSGPTTNTQAANSGATTASVLTTPSHDITGGILTFNPEGSIGMTSNSSAANAFVISSASGGSNVASGNVVVALYDDQNRLVETKKAAVTLRAGTLRVALTGGNATQAGYVSSQTAISSLTASVAAGNVDITSAKTSGTDLAVVKSGNTNITISATRAGIGSNTGVYTVTASSEFYGITISTPLSVTVTATVQDPTLTITPTSNTNALFVNTTATANVTAAAAISGTITFNTTLVSGTPAAISTTGNTISFGKSMTTVGTNSAVYSVAANLYDANGAFVSSNTTTVSVSAQKYNPAFALTITGTSPNNQYSNAAVNIFATVNAAASSNAALTGEVYEFSFLNKGPNTADLASDSTLGTASIVAQANSATTIETCNYDITCTLKKDGEIIGGPLTVAATANAAYMYATAAPSSDTQEMAMATAESSGTMSSSFSVTVLNGSGNYTYSWTKVGGAGVTMSGQTTPTVTGTSFVNGVSSQTTRTASFYCTVTDVTRGLTMVTNTVSMTHIYTRTNYNPE